MTGEDISTCQTLADLGMSTGQLWMGIATIIAVVIGPILAVMVTRFNDDRRAEKTRKFDIFRTLMRTRHLPVHYDHVSALNLVEVEFIKSQEVITAWKNYLASLSEPLPPPEQKAQFDAAIRKRESLRTKLLSEIAKILRVNIEQLDIFSGNYVPQGWHDDDWDQRLARRGLINVLYGRTPIYTAPAPQQSSIYPPPPTQAQLEQQA